MTEDDPRGGGRRALTALRALTRRRSGWPVAHDPLTGLPNRVLFVRRLRAALEQARRAGAHVAVMLLDVDRLKVVNDAFGYAAGDRLLVAMARRLRGGLAPGGAVARLGGDEFMVLCPDVPDEPATLALARGLATEIARPIVLEEGEVLVTAGIGIALSGRGPDDADALLRDAGAALEGAKAAGPARCVLSDGRARERVAEDLRTRSALHQALDRREFEVHYQPVIDLEAGRITGFEALLRWRHPTRGLVAPGEFVTLAEETGLIVPLGAWVLEEACRQAASWQRSFGDDGVLTISVNLSPRQLAEPSLPAEVARVIDATGVDPDALWLEITESTLMQDAESATGALRDLRAQGVHVAVDDFGTGYSSLAYLKRFPVEALKVDRAFVDGLGRDPEDSAIVTACVSLAHALGLTAIAEGVESPTQLAELRTLGCELAQGFLFDRPRPPAELGPRPATTLGTWARL